MQIFFPSINAIDQFTSSLSSLSRENACSHCCKQNQWVSHGYVYKQLSIPVREAVGKRILCANRYGKSGCGHTRQLYLESIIPHRSFDVANLAMFIILLTQGNGIAQAYQQATQKEDINHRQGWRWIQRLFYCLGYFRSLIGRQPNSPSLVTSIPAPILCRRLQLLLPTLTALLPSLDCWLSFQRRQQFRLT